MSDEFIRPAAPGYDVAAHRYREYPDDPGRALRPYQRDIHRATALARAHAAFWEPRTGKSRFTVDTFAAQYEARVANGCAVMAPNRVHEGWPDQFSEWTPEHLLENLKVVVYRTGSAGTKRQERELDALLNHRGMAVLCMSYDGALTEGGAAFLRAFLRRRPCLLVGDESSRIKTPTIELSLRMVGGKRGKKVYEGFRGMAVSRRILDGTPTANEVFDIYMPVKFLDDQFWSREVGVHDFWQFQRYFGVWDKGYVRRGGKVAEYPKFVKYKNMAIMRDLLAKIGSRVRREEMGTHGKFYAVQRFDLSSEQRARYDRVEAGFSEALREYLAGDRAEAPARANALTRLLRLCEVASGFERETYVDNSGPKPRKLSRVVWRSKTNPRLELLESMCADLTTQATIWCAYRPEVDDVVRMLGDRAARFDGAVPDEEALVNKERFRRGDKQFIVSIPSMSTAFGHDYAMARDDVHYNRGWRLLFEEQSEDRTQGPAQTGKVCVTDIVARDTKDDDKIAALRAKEDVQSYLLRDPAKAHRRGDDGSNDGQQMSMLDAMFAEYES